MRAIHFISSSKDSSVEMIHVLFQQLVYCGIQSDKLFGSMM